MKASLIAVAALLATASVADAARFNGRDSLEASGVECHAHEEPQASGETHWCLFEPAQRGRRDFRTRNKRAGHVVSTLGPYCEEIEILDDAEAPAAQQGSPPLRRVSIACTE